MATEYREGQLRALTLPECAVLVDLLTRAEYADLQEVIAIVNIQKTNERTSLDASLKILQRELS